jgi:crotonobetainyl-CoA:carnitine CoA-transferase CaiB-like acyl-CoA transferase
MMNSKAVWVSVLCLVLSVAAFATTTTSTTTTTVAPRGYVPVYQSGDMASGLISAIAAVVIGAASQGTPLGQVVVLVLVLGMMSLALGTLMAAAITAFNQFQKITGKKN